MGTLSILMLHRRVKLDLLFPVLMVHRFQAYLRM